MNTKSKVVTGILCLLAAAFIANRSGLLEATVAETPGKTTVATVEKKARETGSPVTDKPASGMLEDILKTHPEALTGGGERRATVTRVVDGDTLKVRMESSQGEKAEDTVRLLCVDTPESVKQGVAVQPFAKESSAWMSSLIEGKPVRLVFDKDIRDNYDRLLAFVVYEGTLVNLRLVQNGYARVELVKPNTTYAPLFQGALEDAVAQKRGLWALEEVARPFKKNSSGNWVPVYQKP